MKITWGKVIAVVVILGMVWAIRQVVDGHGLDFLPSVQVK